jgi:hypothetical protein
MIFTNILLTSIVRSFRTIAGVWLFCRPYLVVLEVERTGGFGGGDDLVVAGLVVLGGGDDFVVAGLVVLGGVAFAVPDVVREVLDFVVLPGG